MSVLKIKSNNLDLELQLDGNGMVNAIQEGAVLTNDEEKLHVALIALSLNQMLSQGNAHDWETEMITIKHYPTDWNAKSFGFTNTKF